MLMFNQYPYLNLTDINLDFIQKKLKELESNLQDFIKINTIKYADPIQWNITTQYEANTVVIDGNTGTAYLSTQPVPSGVALTNTDYWTVIFTLDILSANQNITFRNDGANVIATFESNIDDWLLWNSQLYKVTRHIAINEAYVVGYNLDRYSVELFIKDYIQALHDMIGNINNLTTTDKSNLVAAINELNSGIGVLSNLTTDNKTNLVLAINELDKNYKSIFVTPEMFGAVGDGITDDSAAIEAASAVACVYGGDHEYYVGSSIDIVNPMICGKYKVAPNAIMAFKKNDSFLYNVDFSNSAYPTDPSDRGEWLLDIYHCKNVEIDGCAFHDGCNALYIDRGENISVNNCTFQDLKQTATGTGGNGYGVLTVQCKDVTISNCKFIDVARHAIYLSHDPDTSDYNDGIVISNNLFRWTPNVSGNTTGFEVTMMIRPSINVLIEGNIFDNVYCIADLHRQRILYNGVLTVKACHNISIKNNVGYFEFKNRDDGVVYLDGASTNSYESHSNIIIEGNDFRVKGTSFIKLANCDGLYIKNNKITMLTGGAYRPLIYNEIPANYADIVKDIIIEGNVIEGESLNGNPLIYFVYGSSSNPKNHGKLIIANNTITKCMYMFVFTGDNARTFELLDICNNNIEFIKSTLNSNNMHDSAITTLKLKNNSFNDIVRLRCATPTNVSSLDAPFTANGLLTAPSDGVVGSLYNNGSALQLRKPDGSWFAFT